MLTEPEIVVSVNKQVDLYNRPNAILEMINVNNDIEPVDNMGIVSWPVTKYQSLFIDI